MEFKDCLVTIRRTKGLSQESLAAEIGVSRQAVSKWENGDAMPDLTKLILLADVLHTSIDELCGRETGMTAEATKPTEDYRTANKHHIVPFIIMGLVTIALAIGGVFLGMQIGNKDTSKNTAVALTLPDTITAKLSSINPSENGVVCVFVPSILNEDYKYQVTYTTHAGEVDTVDATLKDGVCRALLPITEYESYDITVVISRGKDSRSVLLISNFSYNDTSSTYQEE